MTESLEAEARRLRDQCYGKPISDPGWEDPVRKNWIEDIQWLRQWSKDGDR